MLFFGDAAQALTPGPIHMLALLVAGVMVARIARCRDLVGASAARRWRVGLLALVAWVWIFSTPALANWMLAGLEGDPRQQPAHEPARNIDNLFLVMGAGLPASADPDSQARLTAAGWRRIAHAARNWRRFDGRLVIAGGLGDPTDAPASSIATEMARVAREMGVPADRITTVAHDSSNSFEDVLAAREAIAAHVGPTWLVTSAAHVPRVLGIARRLDLSLQPLPCDFRQIHAPGWRSWLPNHGGPDLWQIVLHEIVGLTVYRLRGWATMTVDRRPPRTMATTDDRNARP